MTTMYKAACFLLGSGVLVVASVRAQTAVVVPATFQAADAPGMGGMPGFCSNQRKQIVIAAWHLAALQQRELVGLWVRRDTGWQHALRANQANLTVTLSVTSADPLRPSPSFANNAGSSPTIVFDGVVQLPASPALSSATVPWDATNAVRLVFTTPFSYTGGNLCVDITGAPVPGVTRCFWPVDFATSGPAGSVQTSKRGCGVYSGRSGFDAHAAAGTLRVGDTARFLYWGQPATPAFLLLASAPLGPSFNLAGFGAPACELHVSPVVAMATMITDPGQSFGSGAANVEVQVPAQAGLLGGTLYAQWVNVERSLPPSSWSNLGGITTSNLVAATLSTTPSTLGMATIASPPLPSGWPLPPTGSTHTASAPVLRFEYR